MRLIDGKVIVGLNKEEEEIFQFESFKAEAMLSVTSRCYMKQLSFKTIMLSSLKTRQKLSFLTFKIN